MSALSVDELPKWVTPCPECGGNIHFRRRPQLKQLAACPGCDEILIVRSSDPLLLDWAFEEPLANRDDSA